jgi:hypothetical protein
MTPTVGATTVPAEVGEYRQDFPQTSARYRARAAHAHARANQNDDVSATLACLRRSEKLARPSCLCFEGDGASLTVFACSFFVARAHADRHILAPLTLAHQQAEKRVGPATWINTLPGLNRPPSPHWSTVWSHCATPDRSLDAVIA